MDSLLLLRDILLRGQEGDSFLLFWSKEGLGALLILFLFWGISQLVVQLLLRWRKHLATGSEQSGDDNVVARLSPGLSRLFVVYGAYLAIDSLPFHEKVVVVACGAVFIVLVALVGNLLLILMDEIMGRYVAAQQESAGVLMSRQMMPVARKILSLFLMGAALIVILKHFNYDIFSLVTALGIGSLAIGMAAKDTLAHMISGFTIMLDRPFRIGDRIQLVGGQIGDVADIGLRSTKIKTPDNQLLIIPNSDLCNTMLTNQAFPDQRVKGRVTIGVAYGSDVELVKRVLVATAREVALVLDEPAPEAFFIAFGDSALTMSLFFWVGDYNTLVSVTYQVNTLLLRRFAEHSIEIPFPTRTVRLEK